MMMMLLLLHLPFCRGGSRSRNSSKNPFAGNDDGSLENGAEKQEKNFSSGGPPWGDCPSGRFESP